MYDGETERMYNNNNNKGNTSFAINSIIFFDRRDPFLLCCLPAFLASATVPPHPTCCI
ncbi:hypothetical protein BDB00DRAFT_816784 [Zychaea mexicana]|uniref:uncharacterized protein n=1 Tax=Zychaea mexicana TaxID=64656 RepID=UPI0022FF2358|nr:uncharacterized protein BDB00DRAFT_816784 [Zychaea mexicana]KAI9494718.1 hypothetical protein BDB00DRAFT_816784 [Zychaea mexicana]